MRFLGCRIEYRVQITEYNCHAAQEGAAAFSVML